MAEVPRVYTRVLAATDFSPSAEAAARFAIWVAQQNGAKLVLTHVMTDYRRAFFGSSPQGREQLFAGDIEAFHRDIRRHATAQLHDLVKKLGHPEIATETLIGAPLVEIVHAVQQEHHDLVVVGTRGLPAWEQMLLGSTARRLIRKCPASVMAVRAEHAEPPRIVLAATDFSETSRRAAEEGMAIALQSGAEFHLAHVIDGMLLDELAHVPGGGSFDQKCATVFGARLEELAATLGTDRLQIRQHLLWGFPSQEIARLIKQEHVDLLALGTVGRSGIQGVLMGNTAETLTTKCECNLLVVKPADFVSPISPPFWPLHPE